MSRPLRLAGLMLALTPVWPVSAEPLFGLPLVCPTGSECPIQQFVDLDPGSGARDPWCGTKTYDGHKGTDFRVLSMQDVARGVDVVAMADGVVKATRDGMADRLVLTDEDRQAVSSRECGNGLILDHGGGYETQYCHMRAGSLRLETGTTVRKGDVLGLVGASGMAQFPHVHVTLRRNGKVIDPYTGLQQGQACAVHDAAGASGLLDADAMAAFTAPDQPAVLSAGFAAGAVNGNQLVETGPPKPPGIRSQALVGYIWAINLAKGDSFSLRIEKDGQVFSKQTTQPLDRSKAVYVAYAGKKGSPAAGHYRLETAIIRQGEKILARSVELDVE
ncbi:M23 family metallopeptidase [Hoeflea sp.]|uniref:M23 family metallopeptidase n=1 Tax=Hoeflea sp. TaxID=1940281 RepID=UPI0025B8A086|nr:M23 family metallopeptidase [Hoeflea sp.]